MSSKLTAGLESELLRKAADELVEVVVELAPGVVAAVAGQKEKIAAKKAAFEKISQPVIDAVQRLGGEVTGRGWINCTLKARVPAKALNKLSLSDAVESVDVPAKLQGEQPPGRSEKS